MGGMQPTADTVWLVLGVSLACGVLFGAWRGFRRGPFRVAVSFAGLLLSGALALWIGESVGELLWDGSSVPWVLREFLGALVVFSVLMTSLHLWLWWRGRSGGPGAKVDRPWLGAGLGGALGFFWFMLALLVGLALASACELLADSSGDRRIRARLERVLIVRRTLAENPWTAPLGRLDLLPEKFRRVVPKVFAVLRDRDAFQRLQSDERLRALAAHPAFYPLVKDSTVSDLVKRRDFHGLLSHPKVVALLADDDFQRRLLASDYESMLDRALAGDVHSPR